MMRSLKVKMKFIDYITFSKISLIRFYSQILSTGIKVSIGWLDWV